MIKLGNLQNKLVRLEHKVDKREVELQGMGKEQFEGLIQMELYKQLTDYVMTLFDIQIGYLTENEVTFKSAAYILNQKEMFSLIIEICQLDDVLREKLLKSCEVQLGITPNE